jgi:iron complex outermembrane receptor protein
MAVSVKYALSMTAGVAVAIALGGAPLAAQEIGADAVPDASVDTVLPPVEVMSPSEPIARPKKKAVKRAKAPGGPAKGPAKPKPAEEAATDTEGAEVEGVSEADGYPAISGVLGSGGKGRAGVFTLGQLDMIGGSVVSDEAIWTFNKTTLDQAVNIVPGVTANTLGGRRNERDILVRGFDRLRAPLSIDGVRVYLPADNRLDFARFLTPDVSEIQIQKGYVSVLNGPGGMGGAVNLVSRKPTKEIEGEARLGATFDGRDGARNSWNGYVSSGTRQDMYYAQVSGTLVDVDWWNLSNDFTPTPIENGGARDLSDTRDWRFNAKAGFTPNATDEYAISYTVQSGEKSAPLHVRGEPVTRYWEWPYWDLSSLTWHSKTQIGSDSYVKTIAYYNSFENLLSSYDDRTYTLQTRPFAFDSFYEDFAYGGSIEAGTEIIPMNSLKAAVHYRLDNHQERSFNRPDSPFAFVEPWQEAEEETWSFAVENTFHATGNLDIIGGISYDMNNLGVAEDFSNTGGLFEYPTGGTDAWNWQTGAVYSYSETGKTYATVSSRTRFPTLSERFSTRFGFAIPNPDLQPERSTNYEIGWTDTLFNQARLSSAIFYSDIEDFIQTVALSPTLSQAQNVGTGETYGLEVSADWDVTTTLRIGGNYTYMERELTDPSRPNLRPEGTPRHQAFLYLAWRPTEQLTITPSLELASDRWSLVTQAGPTNGTYIQTGAYALLNVQAEYAFSDTISAAIGARNLTDDNYEISEGFPEAGRSFFANMRAKF